MSKISIINLYTFILITFPLVVSYNLVGISPALFFCLIESILVLLLMHNKKAIILDKRAGIYFVYMLLSAIIGIFNGQFSIYTLCIKLFLYTLTFFVFYVFSWQIINFELITKLYIKIAIILSVLVIIQFAFSLIGKGFSLIPPGIPLAGNNAGLSNTARELQVKTNRYSTIFMEPSHQCQYILPCLAVLMFRDTLKKGKDFILAILVTIGLFCTTSSTGILASVILWSYFGVQLMRRRGVSWIFYFLIFIPLFLSIFIFFLRFEIIGSNLITRLAVLDFRNTERTEGFRRIRYGWICYGDMNIFQKVFGAGYKNFGYYLANTGIGYRLIGTNDIEWISYTNGITGMLIGLGLVGTLLNFRLFFWDSIKSKNSLVHGLLLAWGLIMFSANSFDDIFGTMPMLLAMNITFANKPLKDRLKLVLRTKSNF